MVLLDWVVTGSIALSPLSSALGMVVKALARLPFALILGGPNPMADAGASESVSSTSSTSNDLMVSSDFWKEFCNSLWHAIFS